MLEHARVQCIPVHHISKSILIKDTKCVVLGICRDLNDVRQLIMGLEETPVTLEFSRPSAGGAPYRVTLYRDGGVPPLLVRLARAPLLLSCLALMSYRIWPHYCYCCQICNPLMISLTANTARGHRHQSTQHRSRCPLQSIAVYVPFVIFLQQWRLRCQIAEIRFCRHKVPAKNPCGHVVTILVLELIVFSTYTR